MRRWCSILAELLRYGNSEEATESTDVHQSLGMFKKIIYPYLPQKKYWFPTKDDHFRVGVWGGRTIQSPRFSTDGSVKTSLFSPSLAAGTIRNDRCPATINNFRYSMGDFKGPHCFQKYTHLAGWSPSIMDPVSINFCSTINNDQQPASSINNHHSSFWPIINHHEPSLIGECLVWNHGIL